MNDEFDPDAWEYKPHWITQRIDFKPLPPLPHELNFALESELRMKIYSAFGIPKALLDNPQPSAFASYNCPCHLEFRPEHKPAYLSDWSRMKLGFILLKGGLTTWEHFLKVHPLALDCIEIRYAYQDYILKTIWNSPRRLWAWLRRKKK